MASGTGIRIEAEHTSKFNEICDALEAAGIEHSVWNAEVMMDPDYSGPIDLDCDDRHRFVEFAAIVKRFTAPQTHTEGAD
jgi:hypothetical protein